MDNKMKTAAQLAALAADCRVAEEVARLAHFSPARTDVPAVRCANYVMPPRSTAEADRTFLAYHAASRATVDAENAYEVALRREELVAARPKCCRCCGDVLSTSWGAENDFCRWESCEAAEAELLASPKACP